MRTLRNLFGRTPVASAQSTRNQWSYILSYRLNKARLGQLSEEDALLLDCKVRVHEGRLGIVAASAGGNNFVSHERIVSPTEAIEHVRLWVGRPLEAETLIFRTTAPDGILTRFELLELSAHVMKAGGTFPAPWLEKSTTIPLVELGRALTWAQTVWGDPFEGQHAHAPDGTLEIVDVDQLGATLGSTAVPNLPPQASTKLLSDWKMETDDAPILKALWSAVAPTRHLEFGTWEGFGATLIASVTDAEIWTVNLPDGETDNEGTALYAATDAGSFIGRLYRQAGYGHRIHQVLCDSRAFDTSPFEANPFDTVLIDGGHTPDVVASDTEKALRVLRPGGTCVWHDFCPDPEALRQNLAPLGVVQATVENFANWTAAFERLFWIRKSWILVGLGRK